MMHITYAEKNLLVGDTVADLTLEYGAALASRGKADTITLRAIGADGDEVVAKLLLDAGSNMIAETTRSSLDEPDNSETENYIRERIRFLSAPHTALPSDDEHVDMDEIELDVPGA
jgi:hypothetical protein